MYAGVGALSTSTRDEARSVLPNCYSKQFDACLQDDNRQSPACQRYQPVHLAYEADFEETEQMVDELPYCAYTGQQLGFIVVGAFLGGAIVTALIV